MNPIILGLLAALQAAPVPQFARCENPADYSMQFRAAGARSVEVSQKGENRAPIGIIKTDSGHVPNGVKFVALKRVVRADGFASVVDFWEECR